VDAFCFLDDHPPVLDFMRGVFDTSDPSNSDASTSDLFWCSDDDAAAYNRNCDMVTMAADAFTTDQAPTVRIWRSDFASKTSDGTLTFA
jgi:hypothetical protein